MASSLQACGTVGALVDSATGTLAAPGDFALSDASPLVVDTLACNSRRQRIWQTCAAAAPVVLPSLLLCDFGHLADEVHKLEAAGRQVLHLDVMDGHFVPNLTYGLPIVEAVRRVTTCRSKPT